ncbi:hypothetical protein EP10_001189 [Geobacillus icigianus]|uniref:ABC transporter permease n=1 Tax=Geobacillus icigianus TaxID=1430331 RepID=A0ABU6BEI6_9BACL|nr:hypothetical protein B4113_3908 [Geobacillus sp. B4113_201601]MEB3750350.1 hypothetical protein [Geobacillus icigianus]
MKYLRLLKYFLRTLLYKRNMLIILLTFVAFHFVSFNFYNFQNASVVSILIIFYYGPSYFHFDLFRWLLHQTPIYIFSGNFLNKQLNENNLWILPRVGNFSLWLNGVISANFLFIVIYYSIGYFISILLSYVTNGEKSIRAGLNGSSLLKTYPPLKLMFIQFVLLILLTFFVVLISHVVSILANNAIAGFSVSIMFIFISVGFLQSSPHVNKWMPFSQGVLVRRNLEFYSFAWSLMYYFFAIFIAILLFHYICYKRIDSLLHNKNTL